MSRARIVLAALLVALVVAGIAVATSQKHFRVIAAGEFEVPIRDSPALGRANFYVGQGGETLGYRLSVTKIENVVQAHIHLGPPGANGDSSCGSTRARWGPRATGDGPIRVASLRHDQRGEPRRPAGRYGDLRPHRGHPGGNAYVNVHTNDGVAPANTGPGDFPGGEIRATSERVGEGGAAAHPTFPHPVSRQVVCRPFLFGNSW